MAKANHILYSKQRSFKKSDCENSDVPIFLKIRLWKKIVSFKKSDYENSVVSYDCIPKIEKSVVSQKKSDYEKNVVSPLKKVKGNEELVLCCAKEVKMLTHLIKKEKL
jgi:hypothetical protein